MHPAGMMRQGYYYPQYYPYTSGYNYDDQQHYIFDQNNNIVERNPYPFDGPYFDRRMVEPSDHQVGADRVGYDRYGRLRPYPYYASRYRFHGRVDPYTSYRAYYETPLLAYPQPLPPPQIHPFYTPESMCTIM